MAGMLCLALVSCNKDDEDEILYMSGSLSFDFPSYAFPGESFFVEASGITAPTEDSLSYVYTGASFSPDTLEAASGWIAVPTECGTYTITLTAKADDYSNTTTSLTVTVIPADYTEAVDGFAVPETYIIDNRDSQKYYYKSYGQLDWFVQNVDYEEIGVTYDNVDRIGFMFGSLYTWAQAVTGEQNPQNTPSVTGGLGQGPQGVCPEGWSVPTTDDWAHLATELGGSTKTFFDSWTGLAEGMCLDAKLNGVKMWSYHPDNTKTNTYGWNALPAGYGSLSGDLFTGKGKTAFWWTSQTDASSDQALYRYIYYSVNECPYAQTDKNNVYASVRCVRLRQENITE